MEKGLPASVQLPLKALGRIYSQTNVHYQNYFQTKPLNSTIVLKVDDTVYIVAVENTMIV